MVSVSAVGTAVSRAARSWGQRRQFRRVHRYPWIPLFVVLFLAVCAVFADVISPHDPRGKDESIKIRTQKTLLPPFQSWNNPLGTDRIWVAGR